MALKYSRQRQAIKEFMMTRTDHPTADVVYMNLRNEFPNISLGTIYRNLTLLADLGELARIRVGDGVDRFDATLTPHYHFICQKCGCVSDLDIAFMEHIDTVIAPNFTGRIDGHITYFYGECETCQNDSTMTQ